MLSLNFAINTNHNNIDEYSKIPKMVSWDPNSALQVVDVNGVLGVQSPGMGLAHELAHALLGLTEDEATALETQIARELGEPTRANYDSHGATVHVDNPTEHTDNGHWTAKDIFNQTIRGGLYNGSTNPGPNLGGGTGGGGGGGGGIGNPGGTPVIGGGSGDDDGSVPCPTCYVVPGVFTPPVIDNGNIHLIGIHPLEVL